MRTLGTVGLALLLQAQGEAAADTTSIVGLLARSSAATKIVLLFAAIPAVYFYNSLTQRVKLFASEMDDFAMEFLNIAERNFT